MEYPLLDAFVTMMWFLLWILWIFIVVRIVFNIFGSHDIGGWAKAGWAIFIVVLPFLGVSSYLIARGHSLQDRQCRAAQAQDEAFRSYVRNAAGTGKGSADELAKLVDLSAHDLVTESEFQQGKAKILA